MNNIKFVGKLILVLLFTISIAAQTESVKPQLSLNEGTIDNQFDYIIKKSNKYQDYKVVKTNWLYALKAHTIDSLKALKKDLSSTQTIVDTQANEISSLKNNLTDTQSSLSKTNDEKNNMALFGLQMSKANYNVLMWSIIAGLLALLVFFIYKFNSSNSVTRTVKNNLSEMEEEFDEHRRNSLEREQIVRRQLQDELNKQKGA